MIRPIKPLDLIANNYNDGVIRFYEKEQKKDKYNTPIRGEYSKKLIASEWFRWVGVTAQDTYLANADGERIGAKVAVRFLLNPHVKWVAEINHTEYEIYRTYYSGKRDETEISLTEVTG